MVSLLFEIDFTGLGLSFGHVEINLFMEEDGQEGWGIVRWCADCDRTLTNIARDSPLGRADCECSCVTFAFRFLLEVQFPRFRKGQKFHFGKPEKQ
jgi:hypothetical protein